MINFNGCFSSSEDVLSYNNRAFLYGDGVFETVKIVNCKILFFEDHYFRLMSAMRIVRMSIPLNFTMNFVEQQIISTAILNNCSSSCRARITIYRNGGGNYLPESNSVSFLISTRAIINPRYLIEKEDYHVDIYKEFCIPRQLLSTLKTTNKLINIVGSIFAKENRLNNCILLNESKNVVEMLQGNIFMLKENKLITPPISEGCLNGIMRKQILGIAQKMKNLEVVEEPISPFDLQKADELFMTNVIVGIKPITKYRKKEYETFIANRLLIQVNFIVDLNLEEDFLEY